MTIEKARYWAENMTELSKNDRLWLNNPVIMQGVGLAPMVVAATSGYTALVLAAAVAVMLTPTRVGGAILRKALGEKYNRFAVLCYAFPAVLHCRLFSGSAPVGPQRPAAGGRLPAPAGV